MILSSVWVSRIYYCNEKNKNAGTEKFRTKIESTAFPDCVMRVIMDPDF